MPSGKTIDQIVVGLVTATLLGIGGLIYAETSSHASEDSLKAERKAREAADIKLTQAQAELTAEVNRYIRNQERRDGKIDGLLDRLEKHMDKEGG